MFRKKLGSGWREFWCTFKRQVFVKVAVKFSQPLENWLETRCKMIECDESQ